MRKPKAIYLHDFIAPLLAVVAVLAVIALVSFIAGAVHERASIQVGLCDAHLCRTD